jgi:hypothetical protein
MAYEQKETATEKEPDRHDRDTPEAETEDPNAPFPEYDVNVANIALEWATHEQGELELKELGSRIIEEHKECYKSTEKYRKKTADNWKLFIGDLPPKTYPWKDCLSRDTEILTVTGWRPIASVQVGDYVLTRRDEDGALEWKPVDDTVTREAKELLHFKSKSLDLLVTPGHDMIVHNLYGKVRRMRADAVWETQGLRVPLTGTWDCPEAQLYGLDAGDVAEFVGWCLAEGSMQNSIQIAQSREANEGNCLRIEGLLNRLGFKWAYARHAFTVHVTSMPTELVEAIRSTGKMEEKRLPFGFSLPRRVLERLLDGLILGDGTRCVKKSGARTESFFTTSKRLADEVQAIAQLTGKRARIHRKEPGAVSIIRGKPCKTQLPLYTVNILDKQSAKLDAAKRAIVPYDDNVFCVTVENHSIYVRRNGTAAWVGNCANANVPIVIENVGRNVMRAFGELFGDWFSVFGAVPLGPGGQAEAELVTVHSNWQIREQITDFKRQMYRAMLGYFFIGDMTCHSYYDPVRRTNRHEMLTPDEFCVPFTYTSTQPDYSDCPYYSKILNLYRHDLEARRDQWTYVEEVLDEEASHEDEPEQLLSDKVAKTQGVEKGETTAPYKIVWYEGWIDLPLQDGEKWCRVVVDYKTERVLELVLLEEADWQDTERYNAQLRELDSYRQEAMSYQMMLQSQEQQIQQVAQETLQVGDMMGEQQKMAVVTQLEEAQAMTPPPPIAPTWLDNPDDPEAKPEKVKTSPVRLFTHFVNIEPLVGTLGIGWGGMQGDMARAANTMFNQWVDAATLANIWGMVKSDQIKFKEEFSWAPGAMNEVVGMSGTEIKENLMELKAAPPSPELIQGVSLLYQWASSSMQAPDVLSGASGKSGESAKLQLSRVEQATKQISVTTRKFADDLEFVAKNNAKLNRVHMPDEEIIAVAQARGAPITTFQVKRSLYDRNYRFGITADLRFTSKSQRVQEADELATLFTKQFPTQAQQNPALMFKLMENCIKAREQYQLLMYLGPEPPPLGAPPMPPMPGAPPGQPGAPPPPGSPPGNTPYQGPPQPPAPPAPPGPPGAQGTPNPQ